MFCLVENILYHSLTKGGIMRKRVKGKLYFLARDAKSRMKNFNKEKSIFEQLPYVKACFNVRDQELYEKVKQILSSDEIVINPIKELIDAKYYKTLSLEAKQKYIFDLSEKYKEMKLRFERETNQFANVSNI